MADHCDCSCGCTYSAAESINISLYLDRRETYGLVPASFRNTFAPYVENRELSVDAVIRLLFWGLPYKSLPEEVKQAVRAEMDHRHEKRYENTFLESGNDGLSLQQVVNALVMREITPDELPHHVKGDVDLEIKKKFGVSLEEWFYATSQG